MIESIRLAWGPWDLCQPLFSVNPARGHSYDSLNSFKTRLPQYSAEGKQSSIIFAGLDSKVTQAITEILSETALSWCQISFLDRFLSRISFTSEMASCRGVSNCINTGASIAGFFAFVVIRRNFRCPTNARRTPAAYISHQPQIHNLLPCILPVLRWVPQLPHSTAHIS